jgi:hypothetical protein
MVVLCGNPECNAVLRVGAHETLLQVVLKPSDAGPFFICPRCGISTLAETMADTALEAPPRIAPVHRSAA